MGWKLAKIVNNKVYKIDGLNLFDYDWKKEDQVELKDVAHGMKKMFDICTANLDGKEFQFAVCEIAQGVYNFYLPV